MRKLWRAFKSQWAQSALFAAMATIGGVFHMPVLAVGAYSFIAGFELCVAMKQAREKELRDFVALLESENVRLFAKLALKE